MTYIVETTHHFDKFLSGMKDQSAKIKIAARIRRIESDGNFGDVGSLGNSLFELRCFFGAGYRVYFVIRDKKIVLLLGGGNKKSQNRDIKNAKELLSDL